MQDSYFKKSKNSNKNIKNIQQKGIRAKEEWEAGHTIFARRVQARVGGIEMPQ